MPLRCFSRSLGLRLRRVAVQLLGAGLLAGFLGHAHADVWAYVDTDGVAHFAAERLDPRYELFFRNAETFDTRLDPPPERVLVAPAEPEPPAPPARLLAFFDNSPRYAPVHKILLDVSSVHNIDYELLQALIATESGFNAGAVSPKGAIGLMQLMPDTARRYGVDTDRHGAQDHKLTDPRINIRAGTRYLRDLINMFPGELELALAAYNAGEGAVMRAGNKIPNYKETQNYVKNVMALYAGLKPEPAAATPESRYPHSRVRPAIRGGALRRGNLPAQVPSAPLASGAPVASN